MADRDLLAELAAQPLLKDLNDGQLAHVAACAHRVTVPADEYLVRERQAADTFYLLESGRVAIEARVPGRCPERIQVVGPGDVIGWSWLVPPHRWQFDARVLDAIRAIAINGPCLRAKCEADHELGYLVLRRLLGVVANRLASTRLQMLEAAR